MIDPQALMALLARNKPGMIPPTLSPTTRAPTPGFNPAAMVKGEGTSRILSQLFGLDPRTQAPGISNNPGLKAGMMQAGLSLMAAPKTPGTFMQNVANAIGYGQQVAQGTDAQHGQAQARKAMLDSLPPEMRRLAELLSPDDFSKLVMEQAKPGEGYTLAPGAVRYNASGQEVAKNPVAERDTTPDRPAALRTAMELAGLDPNGPLSADEAPRVMALLKDVERAGASSTSINMPSQAQEYVFKQLESGKEAAIQAMDAIARVDRALPLIDKMPTGRFSNFKEQLAAALRVTGMDDGTALAAADEYQALVGALAVNELKKFGSGTGLSDRDLAEAKGLVGANRTLEPAALRAILQTVKAAQESVISRHRSLLDRLRDEPGFTSATLSLYEIGPTDVLGKYGITPVRR